MARVEPGEIRIERRLAGAPGAVAIRARLYAPVRGTWKSGTVKRGSPRSRPTTFRPARVSSRPRIVPTRPTPISTGSTSGLVVAISFAFLSRGRRGAHWMNVYVQWMHLMSEFRAAAVHALRSPVWGRDDIRDIQSETCNQPAIPHA